MPKRSKFPKLRVHVRKGKGGQVWRSWYYDMRGTGKPDIALGSDYDQAIAEWDKIHNHRPRTVGTLEEAFEAWERDKLPKYENATTRRNYAQSLKTLRPVFGPATWDGIKVRTLKEYLEKRSAKTQANREIALLSVIWGYARELELTALPFPAWKMQIKNKEKPRRVRVTQAAFSTIYRHAPQFLRDAMDISSATAMRVRDVLALTLPDVRDGTLELKEASKTGKTAEFIIAGSVLEPLIERRRQSKAPHLFLLTNGNRQVTERMLTDAWSRARAKALPECPEVAGLYLRHLRKMAAQLAGSLAEAQQLLQHGSAATTQRHYRPSEKLRPVR